LDEYHAFRVGAAEAPKPDLRHCHACGFQMEAKGWLKCPRCNVSLVAESRPSAEEVASRNGVANKIEQLAKKYNFTTYVQGDDGFGGEDEVDDNFIKASWEIVEWMQERITRP
jgi:uncharacterized Zn finger protein (UPF0148 family)